VLDKVTEVEVEAEAGMQVDLVGPLCSRLDYVGQNLRVPKLQVGDVIRISNVGAYGLTASLNGFLSRPAPLEIAYHSCENVNDVAIYQLQGGHRSLPNPGSLVSS
ncbi:MAG: hypothetical protein F6J98_48530, partial [Moorea sp. SIO4G2]|nr:hypothetical protein [Moorena sp. SIO4G2]